MRTDPLTFEVLRHRISSIADEGSAVLGMVSASPVASEANDCNVAIMQADGAAIAIGPGLSSHGIACMLTARYVRAEFQDNPGYRAGDLFLSNDPFLATPHQTCIALVGPVFWADKLVAWVGAGIHIPDAGGNVPGQVSIGAQSIYEEGTPMPPLRIVENGIMRRDIEASFLLRSRTRQQVALDLRALVAACNRLTSRLTEMFASYGVETVTTAFEDMIQYVTAHLEDRIKRVPNGRWESRVWLDYPEDGKIDYYELNLVVAKSETGMTLDFTDCSPQAPAVINCGEPGLLSAVLNGVMTLMGYGLPLSPAAVLRAIRIDSRPGTFVHAVHPAGCSKATTAACHAIREAINLAFGKMFRAAPDLAERAMAGSSGFLPVMELEGLDQRGNRFGVPLLDLGLSAGYGAMPGLDGIDSGGTLGSPLSSIANVETYEYRYPILYLWRRQERDTGGLGAMRGGRGVSMAFMPHNAKGALGVVVHGLGCSVPSTPGLCGGLPGGTNAFRIVRDGTAYEALGRSAVPQAADALGGTVELAAGLYRTSLAPGDVIIGQVNGGGGLDDPLRRDPALVLKDIGLGAVSPEWAELGYGVVVRGNAIDAEATRVLRAARRGERLDKPGSASEPKSCRHERVFTRCARLATLGKGVFPNGDDGEFRGRLFVCEDCGTLVDVVIERSSATLAYA
ncbi:MAG: hydantoinase B/oxoprolinase family protein [Alphaproteobacteria bacterium]|nr:hydantoinase B/oxoprolinase family protein [Alphaproteobacteria bacterium]